MTWLIYAFASAVTAAVTAILAKVGVEGIPSTLATAVRTVVVLLRREAVTGTMTGVVERRYTPT